MRAEPPQNSSMTALEVSVAKCQELSGSSSNIPGDLLNGIRLVSMWMEFGVAVLQNGDNTCKVYGENARPRSAQFGEKKNSRCSDKVILRKNLGLKCRVNFISDSAISIATNSFGLPPSSVRTGRWRRCVESQRFATKLSGVLGPGRASDQQGPKGWLTLLTASSFS